MDIKKLCLCYMLAVVLIFLTGSIAYAYNTYHGNTESKIYHNKDCKYFLCKKCTAVFYSTRAAEEAGYRKCRVCFDNVNTDVIRNKAKGNEGYKKLDDIFVKSN